MSVAPRYRRVLLKVSGEALMGSSSYGIDVSALERIAGDIKDAADAGAQICLVIGGGNIFRGLSGVAAGIDQPVLGHARLPVGDTKGFVVFPH